MGNTRAALASGSTCSRIQKLSLKDKLKKKLRNVRNKKTGANKLKKNKCRIRNSGRKDIQRDDASIETSNDYVRPSAATSGNCISPMVTDYVYPPADPIFINHEVDEVKCAPSEELNNYSSLRYLGMTYKRKNKEDFRKDEISFVFEVTQENQAPCNNTSCDTSLIRTAEVGQFKNKIEASFSNESIFASCNEHLSMKTDFDVAHASSFGCEDDSSSTILEDTASKYGKVYYRKRWKNSFMGTNSTTSSQMFLMLQIPNGSNKAFNKVLSADKETSPLIRLCPDSEIVMPPLSNSASNLADETQYVETIKNNMTCDMIIEERIISGCTRDTQKICSDINCISLPIATSFNLDGCNATSRSNELRRETAILECVTNEESISNSVAVADLLDRYLDVSTGLENELNSSPISPAMKRKTSVTVLDFNTSEESALKSVAIKTSNNLMYGYYDPSTSQEKELEFSPMSPVMKHVSSDMTKDQLKCLNLTTTSPAETFPSCLKKLIVLDLNGILADINQDYRCAYKAHNKVGGKFVFRRPYCDDFLKFCFERFHVGVWSSRIRRNVDAVVDCLMGNLRHKLLFCWDQSRCTITGHGTIENMKKPLFLKELSKLWNKEDPHLPWKNGEYSPCNTLLVDDSPCKSICNPPYTAVFPYPYSVIDENDKSLGTEGDLRVYLEGLAGADDVQVYIRGHPFGQKAIEDGDPHWHFYGPIIDKIRYSRR